MVVKRKEEVRELSVKAESLTHQIESLFTELTSVSVQINNQLNKIDDARKKLIWSKQTLMKLLQRI